MDEWRGNGVQLVLDRWTLALRWRWHLRFVRPPMKPGYTRLYAGPLEVERRKAPNGSHQRETTALTKPDSATD